MNIYINDLISGIKSGKGFNVRKPISLVDLLYIDNSGNSLLEYMLEYNISYHYSLIPGLNSSARAIEVFCRYDKLDLIVGIKSDVLIENIDGNICLLEYIINNNMVDKLRINSLDYNSKLLDILIRYDLRDLIKLVVFNEEDFVRCLELLIRSKYINLVKIPFINYHSEIIDVFVKYNRFDIINKIVFSEKLLIDEGLLVRLIGLDCNPVISHCSNRIINYLYKLDRPDVLINYFKESNNINKIFYRVGNKCVIDYLLKYDLDFRYIGINSQYISNVEDLVSLYIKFSKYDKLNYLYEVDKDEFLKRKDELFGLFIKYDREEFLRIIKYYNLDKDIDIVTYLKLNNIPIRNRFVPESIDDEFSSFPLSYSNKNIEDSINYDDLGDDKVNLLIRLEELLFDGSNRELVDILVLSYAKGLSKGDKYIFIELKKLIRILESHRECLISKSNYSYFNENDGLHLDILDINTLNHELGHLFHYYLVNDEVPDGFEEVINSIRNRKDLINKVKRLSKCISEYENNLSFRIEFEYNKWAKEYYTPEKIEEIRKFFNSSKEKKIRVFKRLGYDEDKLNDILDNSYSVESYMFSNKKDKCDEMLENIMYVYNSEIYAISDIVDAIYGGLFYNSMLYDSDGDIIVGSHGHGILYYNSIDVIFQEIFANYCLLIKSDRSKQIFDILRDLVGDDLIVLLDGFYSDMINNNKYVDEFRRSL